MKLEPEEFQISVLYGHDFTVTLRNRADMEIIIIFNNEGMISHCRECLSHTLEENPAMIYDTIHLSMHDPFCPPHRVSGLIGDGLHAQADAEDGDLTFKISNSIKAEKRIERDGTAPVK